MHPPSLAFASERRLCLLAFARSHDAQLSAVSAALTTTEITQLRATLNQLVELGAIAIFRLDTPLVETGDLRAIVGFLREQVGDLLTDAAIAAAVYRATPTPKPQTLVPIWPFERLTGDPDVLTASGVFMGMPIDFEAIPILDADLMRLAPRVTARFSAWRSALRDPEMIGTVAIPGSHAAHAVFASVQAS